jgi:hypothetical protein
MDFQRYWRIGDSLYRSFSLFDISLGHFSLFENILKYAHFVGVPREGLEKFENLENVAED